MERIEKREEAVSIYPVAVTALSLEKILVTELITAFYAVKSRAAKVPCFAQTASLLPLLSSFCFSLFFLFCFILSSLSSRPPLLSLLSLLS